MLGEETQRWSRTAREMTMSDSVKLFLRMQAFLTANTELAEAISGMLVAREELSRH